MSWVSWVKEKTHEGRLSEASALFEGRAKTRDKVGTAEGSWFYAILRRKTKRFRRRDNKDERGENYCDDSLKRVRGGYLCRYSNPPGRPRRTSAWSERIYRKTRKFLDCQVKPNTLPHESTLSVTRKEKLGTISQPERRCPLLDDETSQRQDLVASPSSLHSVVVFKWYNIKVTLIPYFSSHPTA